MKKFELQIIDKGEDKSDIIEKINNLSQTLRNNTNPNQHILAYTDGSTETSKRKSQNSGYGIQITTNSHIPSISPRHSHWRQHSHLAQRTRERTPSRRVEKTQSPRASPSSISSTDQESYD